MDPSLGLIVSVYGTVVLLWIFGGLFLRKISGRQLGFGHPFKQTWKVFFAWILPPWKRAAKTFISALLITLGILSIMLGYGWQYGEQVTGYRYVLAQGYAEQHLVTLDHYVTGEVLVPTYGLIPFPIKTGISIPYISGINVIFGVFLIFLGLCIASYWITKANNEEYGVK